MISAPSSCESHTGQPPGLPGTTLRAPADTGTLSLPEARTDSPCCRREARPRGRKSQACFRPWPAAGWKPSWDAAAESGVPQEPTTDRQARPHLVRKHV